MARVFVAMSGGVDSSTAAALLVDAGHEVTGVTMRLLGGEAPDGCCSADGVRAARRVCDVLGIPHYTLEFADVFRDRVIEPYLDSYAAGRTPNPCIECNDRVKFSELMRRVCLQGADFLATGHYARIVEAEGEPWLARAADASKDQSYFLYRMTAPQLAHTMFPVGQMTKDAVRAYARSAGLPTAERPESQETCFVRDGDVRGFVRASRPEAFVAGLVLDEDGSIVGAHDGVPGYTIGQRRGLGVAAGERRYVTATDIAARVVLLGAAPPKARVVLARDVRWRLEGGPVEVTARTRYRGPEARGIAVREGDRLTVQFTEWTDMPAAGQALVCYVGDRVVGGGVIEEAS